MNPSQSKQRFEQFVATIGCSLATLSAPDAVRLMLAFYRQVRVANCQLDQDGDMLVFQWGATDVGAKETFRYELIRQFIVPGDEDHDGMSELSLALQYPMTDALRSLQGLMECPSPAESDKLEQFIGSHETTKALCSLVPLQLTLVWTTT